MSRRSGPGLSRRTSAAAPVVRIHYRRLPDRETVYEQRLVHDDGRVKVTFARGLAMARPLRIGEAVALEEGSDAVWFTFPGAWHDIGRFHRRDGTLTGIYANVITPCLFEPGGVWHTIDLFVDLWVPAVSQQGVSQLGHPPRKSGGLDASGAPRLLDLDELRAAELNGVVSAALARRAREEGRTLLAAARSGDWPPPPVRAWSRERVLRELAGS